MVRVIFAVHHSAPIVLLLLAGVMLLAFAALHDIGFRTVPNRVSAAILLCGLALRLLDGNLPWGCLCGLLMFAATYACWRFGWMGGADVKLLTASSVFVPPSLVPTLVIGTSLAGGILALIYIVGSRVAPRPGPGLPVPRSDSLLRRAARCELRRLRRRGPLPYATAIAAGGLIAIANAVS
jgi:prepilin peptidase CpaA